MQFPVRRPVILEGIAREGETVNINAPSKIGKSWLIYGMVLSFLTGTPWLGKFSARKGKVLIIDNELHPEELSYRIQFVAKRLEVSSKCMDRLDIVCLRGRLMDYKTLAMCLQIEDDYSAIFIDAHYRMLSEGVDENASAGIRQAYNLIDGMAYGRSAMWMLVHHQSKGDQATKQVTDVGAGSGVQARACDAHLILRPQETHGAYVLEGDVRSFPPLEPMTVVWEDRILRPAPHLDPKALKTAQTANHQRKDEVTINQMLAAWRQHGALSASQMTRFVTGDVRRLTRLAEQMKQDGRVMSNPSGTYYVAKPTINVAS
jgi:hypothetical protein